MFILHHFLCCQQKHGLYSTNFYKKWNIKLNLLCLNVVESIQNSERKISYILVHLLKTFDTWTRRHFSSSDWLPSRHFLSMLVLIGCSSVTLGDRAFWLVLCRNFGWSCFLIGRPVTSNWTITKTSKTWRKSQNVWILSFEVIFFAEALFQIRRRDTSTKSPETGS